MEVQNPFQTGCEVVSVTICFVFAVYVNPGNTFADFEDQDADHYGLSGSATQVERIFPPEKVAQKFSIEGDAETQAQALFGLLADKKML